MKGPSLMTSDKNALEGAYQSYVCVGGGQNAAAKSEKDSVLMANTYILSAYFIHVCRETTQLT